MEIRKVFGISCFFITILLLTQYYFYNGNLLRDWVSSYGITIVKIHQRQIISSSIKHDKWIVITTVSQPTEDVKKLAGLKNWKIVIVADTKTPNNWSYENCIFLSVALQQSLNYKIVRLLPYKSYTRKMIGYLYAIENGAKFIYDTDDDNLPINLGLDLFDYSNYTSGLLRHHSQVDNFTEGEPQFFNVYSHFGLSDIWPRGFPLELISQQDKTRSMLCRQIKSPIIQQGLVDKDADVDAIYRMIFVKGKIKGLNVHFDPIAPPVILDENIYCPFNSQNTLFHYDAFWALLLPTTVKFRVTDIWRGYWAQRLLHLTGNYLGFYGPNARQTRNPHDYFKDFIDEDQLYTDSAKLVKIIQQWTCTHEEFSTCILDLSMLLVTNKLWGINDYKLTKAWIEDLNTIGYKLPAKSNHSNLSTFDSCKMSDFTSKMKMQTDPTTQKVQNLMKLNQLCETVLPTKFQSSGFNEIQFTHTKTVVLMVVFNHPRFAHIPLLQTIYKTFFANVIFCGTFPEDLDNVTNSSPFFSNLWPEIEKFSYVSVTKEEINSGYFHYICLNKVIDQKITNISGYIVIADDMLFNFWNHFNVEKTLFSTSFCGNASKDNWYWWKGDFGEKRLKNMSKYLNDTSKVQIDDDTLEELKEILLEPMHCVSDIYYVPQRFGRKYKALSQLFFDHKVFVELAVPRIMYLLGWANENEFSDLLFFNNTEVILTGTYWWHWQRGGDNAFPYYNESHNFLHTVKLSQLEHNKTLLHPFCNKYLKSLMKAINT